MVKTGFSTERLKWENILIKILNSWVIGMKVSELTRLSIKQTAHRPRLGQNVTGKHRRWSAQVVLMFANVSKLAKYTRVVVMPRACCEVTPTFDYVNCWRSNWLKMFVWLWKMLRWHQCKQASERGHNMSELYRYIQPLSLAKILQHKYQCFSSELTSGLYPQ